MLPEWTLLSLFMVYISSDPHDAPEHPMRYSTQVKPISWLKAHAAEALETLATQREPFLITQNGEAKAVLMDLASYEQQQETLALLKLLALGERDVREGRTSSVDDMFDRVLARKRGATGNAA